MKSILKIILAFGLSFIMISCQSVRTIAAENKSVNPMVFTLSRSELTGTNQRFIQNNGFLSMNINDSAVIRARSFIQEHTGRKLNFLKSISRNSEAHVTVVTPPEFVLLSKHLSQSDMDEVALQSDIQNSDIEVLGLGHGSAHVDMKTQETYFFVVKSENLLRIRNSIQQKFIDNGGSAKDFDPNHFFPHITIGFTLRDLHENDNVIKDLAHSLDSRFQIRFVD